MRFTFVPHPIAGRTAEQSHRYILGKDPLTGKPILQELTDALTKPLTSEEKKTGFLVRPAQPRLLAPDTSLNLERLFHSSGWTDGLPIVLPTEARVAEMLKGTSRKADEIVGTMRPSPPHEAWEYTVERVAVNAVMAGARPEYFPVILALASTGVTSLFTSTTSFARMMVVNGPIAGEISMNAGIGAMGPFNEANATIGRSWTLISKNLGGGGVPGETYLGSQGSNLNYNNGCFPETEEALPAGWNPLHVQKGFKANESVVSTFTGWSISNKGNNFKTFGGYKVCLITPPVIEVLAQGYTKQSLKEDLLRNARGTAYESAYTAAYGWPPGTPPKFEDALKRTLGSKTAEKGKLPPCLSYPGKLKNCRSARWQCDGSYRVQTNPVNGKPENCALTAKEIRYWDRIPEIFKFDRHKECRECPFRGGWFQWMRNLVRGLFGAAFRAMLHSVRNHLGDLLESRDLFRKLSFNPVFTGSPTGFSQFSMSSYLSQRA